MDIAGGYLQFHRHHSGSANQRNTGCTLNSCVRVSSIETVDRIKNCKLRVVVDLSICGARSRSFLPSSLYAGESAVESAIRQMTAAGVKVAGRVEWR